MATLAELGYARATTTAVCQRASVSQGALFKHFPTKTLLLGAAVEHLFAELVQDYRRAFAQVPARGERVAAALRLLWRVFRQPRLQIAFELYSAARSDADLRRTLTPVLKRNRANLQREARALFPDAAARNAGFDAAVDTVLSALQGLALTALSFPDRASERRQLEFLERLARMELGA